MMLILLPLANPYGDEENINIYFDFPWNNSGSRTAGAKAINHIFETHLIQSGIAFYGIILHNIFSWFQHYSIPLGFSIKQQS